MACLVGSQSVHSGLDITLIIYIIYITLHLLFFPTCVVIIGLSGDPAHTGGCVHEPSSSGTPVEGESTRTNEVSQDTLNTSAITSLCHSEGEMLNQQSSVCCESEERVSSYNDSGAGQNEVTTEDKPGVSTESGQVAVQSHSTVDLEVRSETEFHGLIASTHTMEQCLPNCAHKKKAVSVLQCVSGDLSEESVAQQKAEAHPFEAAVEVCNDLHPEEVVGALDLAVMDEGKLTYCLYSNQEMQ